METTLTPAESVRLISVLKEIAGDKPIHELRRFKRRTVALGAWVKVISPGRARHQLCRVMLANVSARGVGLLAGRPFNLGDRVVLRLPFKEGGGWLVLASIRNVGTVAQGTYRAGAEFVSWVDDPTGETPVPRDWVISWNQAMHVEAAPGPLRALTDEEERLRLAFDASPDPSLPYS